MQQAYVAYTAVTGVINLYGSALARSILGPAPGNGPTCYEG